MAQAGEQVPSAVRGRRGVAEQACPQHPRRALEDILRKIDGKKSNGVHDDTPMNGNARSHDTPAGAVHTINWKAKFGGMTVSEAQRLKELEQENNKLKRLLAESMLDNAALKELLARK